MLNRISKTVAYATLVGATAQQRESVRIIFTLLSILMNIIYVMPKSVSLIYFANKVFYLKILSLCFYVISVSQEKPLRLNSMCNKMPIKALSLIQI